MSITRQDVKLVYDDPPVGVIATPPGSGLIASLASGVPLLTGVGGGGAPDLFLDFNNGPSLAALGLNIAGSKSTYGPDLPVWPAQWRKHSYDPTGGRGGSGAIRMHWVTDMSIGFSPVWVDPLLLPTSRKWKCAYYARQNAPMLASGSNRKSNRCRVGSSTTSTDNIGTLMSGSGDAASFYWEFWTSNDPVSASQLNFDWPTDDLWHLWELEYDYSETLGVPVVPDPGTTEQNHFTFWLDGVLQKTVNQGSRVGDLMAGATHLWHSPFCEMYSCGDTGACSAFINTGDFWVDEFSYTALA